VLVALPKLDFKFRTRLSSALQALGMRAAFGDADFTGIAAADLAIGDVIHEAAIEVFEGGTVAAAATAVVLTGSNSAAPQYLQLDIDRPFLFAIVDQPTGAVLFLGRVLDPTLR
jgi:serpin B